MADLHELGCPVDDGQDFNGGPFRPGSKESQGMDLRLVFFQEDLVLAFLQIQHGVVYYFLAPLLMLLTSYQFSAQAFFGIVL